MIKNLLLALFISLISTGFTSGKSFFVDTTTDQLRTLLEREYSGGAITVGDISLHSSEKIHAFYDRRNLKEAWSENGVLLELAYELRFEIRQSKFDGLNPEDYYLGRIDAYFQKFETNKKSGIQNDLIELASLDLLLTDAFFKLASHLEQGKVDPTELNSDWEISRKPQKEDPINLLSTAIESKEVRKNLEKLYPEFTIYRKGREVIRALDELKKKDSLDWKGIKVVKSIKVGDSDNAIPAIRERLLFWGHLKPYDYSDPKLYDSTLFLGVKSFQARNGMEPDGAIGKNTAAGLNASPSSLMDKAAVNMERLRWLPDTVRDAEFILVNIANYQLDYLKNLDTLFSARVIVGKQYHESPIFTAPMSYIVFSPYWNIPPSITRSEIMPAVRKNPNYLNQKNMEVVTGDGKLVNPNSVNWSARSFPYMVRQKPGGSNSLGLVKFMFPNSHNVYIHDTPARTLFAKEDRALSHGCIRIQDPAKFAEVLLKDLPGWTPERIDKAMHQTSEQIVRLPRKIPVVLVYLTFWADSKGQPHFRQDIYNRDAEVLELLKK
ncbi:MAG TPA: L,D-transpeptidase family protein [Algoriphagus sp.]|nr:L,D-transpeptidase family protein [Algoriphagus sp.]